MRAKRIINRVIRLILLILLGLGMLLYLAGVVLKVSGAMDFRPSDTKLLQRLNSDGGHASLNAADVQGMHISYAAVRATTRNPRVAVFFVHGSPGSMDAFTVYLKDQHLQSHAELYAYDRLGYGESRPDKGEGKLSIQSAELAALIRYIGADCNILVGHSLGCTIAAYLAQAEPDLVDGIVLVAAPIDPDLEPSSWWRPVLNFPIVSFAMPRSFLVSNDELAPLKRELEQCLPDWGRLHCAVTFIHGNKDNLVPVQNVGFGMRMMTHASAMKEVILDGKGHFILWTDVGLISDEIIEMAEKCKSITN